MIYFGYNIKIEERNFVEGLIEILNGAFCAESKNWGANLVSRSMGTGEIMRLRWNIKVGGWILWKELQEAEKTYFEREHKNLGSTACERNNRRWKWGLLGRAWKLVLWFYRIERGYLGMLGGRRGKKSQKISKNFKKHLIFWTKFIILYIEMREKRSEKMRSKTKGGKDDCLAVFLQSLARLWG